MPIFMRTMACKMLMGDGLNACFSTSNIRMKIIPKNIKGKSKSSQNWLTRQLNDPYVKMAKLHNYRARSAFKLIQIHEKHNVFKAGQVVVECGAAPGAWTQVAIPLINSLPSDYESRKGLLIGVDLLAIHPLPGAIFVNNADFTKPETHKKIQEHLDGIKVDLVLSDMAPNTTGMKELDHDRIYNLVQHVMDFARANTRLNGKLLMKFWSGQNDNLMMEQLKQHYKSIKIISPDATRNETTEMYYFCKGFLGGEKF